MDLTPPVLKVTFLSLYSNNQSIVLQRLEDLLQGVITFRTLHTCIIKVLIKMSQHSTIHCIVRELTDNDVFVIMLI